MDVLEHVEYDAELLASYREFLPPQATLIITVPAFQFLWSGHDTFLGHYRRYTAKTLRATIERAGYDVTGVHYFYSLVFPAALIDRMLSPGRMEPRSHLKRYGTITNALLYAACAVELPIMHFNRAVGLTVCATCQPA